MLKPKQIHAIGLQMQGLAKGDVAKEVGITPNTLCNWQADAEFQKAYDTALRQMQADMIPDALSTVHRLTRCGNPSVELGACKTLLERSILLAGQKIETSGKITIDVDIVEDTDGDIDA